MSTGDCITRDFRSANPTVLGPPFCNMKAWNREELRNENRYRKWPRWWHVEIGRKWENERMGGGRQQSHLAPFPFLELLPRLRCYCNAPLLILKVARTWKNFTSPGLVGKLKRTFFPPTRIHLSLFLPLLGAFDCCFALELEEFVFCEPPVAHTDGRSKMMFVAFVSISINRQTCAVLGKLRFGPGFFLEWGEGH